MMVNFDEIRQKYFTHHQDGVARLNNGSFGAVPKPVLEAQEHYRCKWLAQPDGYLYQGGRSEDLLASRSAVANMVNCKVEDLTLVENATVGGNVVALRTMFGFMEGEFQKGDTVLLMRAAYGAFKKLFAGYAERAGAKLVYVDVPFPLESEGQVLAALLNALHNEKGRICLASLDHITSMPGLVLPIKQMVEICHAAGVQEVLVDGAHAVGSVPVDVTDINAEYYLSNLHKWLFCPSGVCFFHCKPEVAAKLHYPALSHGYGQGLVAECDFNGTKDYSALMVVPKAIEFYESVLEGQSIPEHLRTVCLAKARMLAQAWGTKIAAPESMCASMAMVQLPVAVHLPTSKEAYSWRAWLRTERGIETFLYSPEDGTNLGYVRLSYQIYNLDDDYDRLRDAVLEMCHMELPAAYSTMEVPGH